MKPLTKLQLWMIGISVGAFIAILVVPSTGWYARNDVVSLVKPSDALTGNSDRDKELTIIAQHPNDYQLQLVGIDSRLASSPTVEQSRELFVNLARRFRSKPSVYANALRNAFLRQVFNIETSKQETLFEGYVPQPTANDHPITPQQQRSIDTFIEESKTGESLDSDNAFFPMMLCTGYYANRQYDLADAALERAGHCHRWNEYVNDDIYGKLRLTEIANGGLNGVDTVATVAAELYPGYADIRSVARMAVWQARLAESSGDPAKGIALRQALAHSNALLRAQSSTLIGTLFAIAVIAIAESHPGEKPIHKTMPPFPPGTNTSQLIALRNAQRISNYEAFLTAHGEPAEAKWIGQEAKVDDDLISTFRSGFYTTYEDAWMKDGALLTCTWFALVLCVLTIAAYLLAWLSSIIASRLANTTKIKRVIAQGLLLISSFGVLALLINLVVNEDMSGQILFAFTNVQVSVSPDTFVETTRLLLGFVFALFPVVAVVIAMVRKRPIFDSAVSSVTTVSLPLSCILLVLFGGLTVTTARIDNQLKQQMNTRLRMGEGQYYAMRFGAPWPGPVPDPGWK